MMISRKISHWTPKTISWLGKVPDVQIARWLGITPAAVLGKRRRLGIPLFSGQKGNRNQKKGRRRDSVLGARAVTANARRSKGRRSRLASVGAPALPDGAIRLLGVKADAEIGRRFKIPLGRVIKARKSLGIPLPFQPSGWTPKMIKALGTDIDRKVALKFNIGKGVVQKKRTQLGIPPFVKKSGSAITRNKKKIALVGAARNRKVGKKLGWPSSTVTGYRKQLKIPASKGVHRQSMEKKWTAACLKKFGKIPDALLAHQMGLTFAQVKRKRQGLGIPGYQPKPFVWSRRNLARLGKETDIAIARELGLDVVKVRFKRESLGISSFLKRIKLPLSGPIWDKLGRVEDEEIAKELGVSFWTIRRIRTKLGIKKIISSWTPSTTAWLGKKPDSEIARRLGISSQAVGRRRKKLNIPHYGSQQGKPLKKSGQAGFRRMKSKKRRKTSASFRPARYPLTFARKAKRKPRTPKRRLP